MIAGNVGVVFTRSQPTSPFCHTGLNRERSLKLEYFENGLAKDIYEY